MFSAERHLFGRVLPDEHDHLLARQAMSSFSVSVSAVGGRRGRRRGQAVMVNGYAAVGAGVGKVLPGTVETEVLR
jgi:hypothetical protein